MEYLWYSDVWFFDKKSGGLWTCTRQQTTRVIWNCMIKHWSNSLYIETQYKSKAPCFVRLCWIINSLVLKCLVKSDKWIQSIYFPNVQITIIQTSRYNDAGSFRRHVVYLFNSTIVHYSKVLHPYYKCWPPKATTWDCFRWLAALLLASWSPTSQERDLLVSRLLLLSGTTTGRVHLSRGSCVPLQPCWISKWGQSSLPARTSAAEIALIFLRNKSKQYNIVVLWKVSSCFRRVMEEMPIQPSAPLGEGRCSIGHQFLPGPSGPRWPARRHSETEK